MTLLHDWTWNNKIFLQLLSLWVWVASQRSLIRKQSSYAFPKYGIHRSLCTDLPPPLEKIGFFSEGGGTSVHRLNSPLMHDISNWAPKGDVMEIAGFPYKPQMYNQERLLILVGTCKNCFVAVVSFPSTSTFTDVLFDSIFVLKTGSSIETWTGITSLVKNDTVEWTWNKKISIKKKGLRSSCNQTVLPLMKSSPHNNSAIDKDY